MRSAPFYGDPKEKVAFREGSARFFHHGESIVRISSNQRGEQSPLEQWCVCRGTDWVKASLLLSGWVQEFGYGRGERESEIVQDL